MNAPSVAVLVDGSFMFCSCEELKHGCAVSLCVRRQSVFSHVQSALVEGVAPLQKHRMCSECLLSKHDILEIIVKYYSEES